MRERERGEWDRGLTCLTEGLKFYANINKKCWSGVGARRGCAIMPSQLIQYVLLFFSENNSK